MKVAIVFVLAMLSAVATPASAEWTFIGETTSGHQFFIDLATLKKGARPKAWFMTNYAKRTEMGDLSSKILREADCREEKTRLLASRFYTEPMGEGIASGTNDQPTEWVYVTPEGMIEKLFRILCHSNQ